MFYVKCTVLQHLGYSELNTSMISIVTYNGKGKVFVVNSKLLVNNNLLKIDSFVEITKCIKIVIGNDEIYVNKDQLVRKYSLDINIKLAEKEIN